MAGRFSLCQGTLGEAIKDDKVTMFVKVDDWKLSTRTLPTSSHSSFSTWSSRSSNSGTPISPLVSSNLGTRSSTRSTNRDEMDLTLKKKSEDEEEKIVPDTKISRWTTLWPWSKDKGRTCRGYHGRSQTTVGISTFR